MAEKHYNINYLEGTARLLQKLKEDSYQSFIHIGSGHIADLGCGTGIDALNLARLLGAQVAVTGLDHDTQMIEKARASIKDETNITFIQGDVDALPFEPGSLDGARAERLFQHLVHPQQALEAVWGRLRPGAPLVIVETDWSSLSFYQGNVGVVEKINHFLTSTKINNGFAARKLSAGLAEAGFRNLTTQIYPVVLQSLQEAYDYFWIDRIVAEMTEKNILTAAEQTTFIDTLRAADEAGYFTCAINVILLTGIK